VTTDFFNSAQSAVSYAATAAELILLVRLAWLGLLREFKIFAIYLIFDAIRTVTLASWDYHALSYELIWATTVPMATILLAGASFELSGGLRRPFRSETGNRAFGLYGFLIGMTVGALVAMLAHPQAVHRSAILLVIIARKSVLTGCIVGILAQSAYLTLGDAPLLANWRLHRRLLLTYTTAVVVGLFATGSTNRQYVEWVNLSSSILLFSCFCVWTILLSPAFKQSWATVDDAFPYGSLLTSRSENEESLA
jgi:hypothetical protein